MELVEILMLAVDKGELLECIYWPEKRRCKCTGEIVSVQYIADCLCLL